MATARHFPVPRILTPHRRRRGSGDYYTDHCTGSFRWLNPFCYLYPSQFASSVIESGYPAPPPPVPIAQPTLVPTGGVDVAGNPTYDLVPQTPQENQAANVANLQSFFSNVADANPPPPSPGGSPLLIVAGIVAVVGGLLLLSPGRGRR